MSDDDLKTIQKDLKAEGVTFEYSDLKRNKNGEITGINTKFTSETGSTTYNTDSDEPIKKFYFRMSDKTFGVGQLNPNTFTFKSKDGGTTIQSTTGDIIVVEEIDEETDDKSGKVKIVKRSNIDTVYFNSKGVKPIRGLLMMENLLRSMLPIKTKIHSTTELNLTNQSILSMEKL